VLRGAVLLRGVLGGCGGLGYGVAVMWTEEVRARLALPIDEWWSLMVKRAFEAKSSEAYQIKGDVDAALGEIEAVNQVLDCLCSQEPCPKCGYGVTAACYGCALKAALAEIERLRELVAVQYRVNEEMGVELRQAESYAAEIAQGVSHYPHKDGEPCVRCEAEARVRTLEEVLPDLLEAVLALPIRGGIEGIDRVRVATEKARAALAGEGKP